MKLTFKILAAVVMLVAAEQRSQARFIFGTQAFSSTATTSSPNVNAIGDTNFTLNFSTLLGGANQTDDYVGTFGSFVNALDTTNPLAFVFGSALYGTFTPTAVLVNNLIPNTSRTISLEGTFSPSAATFGPGFDPTPGVLTITINTAIIGGKSVLSGSASLATEGVIPEPGSLVMLAGAIGPMGFFYVVRRRRARSLPA